MHHLTWVVHFRTWNFMRVNVPTRKPIRRKPELESERIGMDDVWHR